MAGLQATGSTNSNGFYEYDMSLAMQLKEQLESRTRGSNWTLLLVPSCEKTQKLSCPRVWFACLSINATKCMLRIVIEARQMIFQCCEMIANNGKQRHSGPAMAYRRMTSKWIENTKINDLVIRVLFYLSTCSIILKVFLY